MKNLIVTAGIFFTAATAGAVQPPQRPQAPPYAAGIRFSPDGRRALLEFQNPGGPGLASPCQLLDATNGQVIQGFPGGGFSLLGTAAFLPDDQLLLLSVERLDGLQASVWDVKTGKQVRTLPTTDRYHARSVAASADGKRALTGHWEGHLKLWDLPAGKLLGRLDTPRQEVSSKYMVTQVGFLPGDRRALSASGEKLKMWDLDTRKEVPGFQGRHHAFPFALSPDGKRAVSPWYGQRPDPPRFLVVWEVETGKEIRRILSDGNQALAGLFTPDGKGLLSGGSDNTIQRWDIDGGTEVWSLTVDAVETPLTAVAFSPDGKGAVTGNQEGSVKLWDLTRRKLLRLLRGPSAGFHGERFVPLKDRLLLTALTENLADRDAAVRIHAAEDLAKVGPQAAPLLLRSIRDRDAAVRRESARALGKIRQPGVELVPALKEALQDQDARVRVLAAEALALVGGDVRFPVSALRSELTDEALAVRLEVVRALGAIAGRGDEEAPARVLAKALGNDRAEVRRAAGAVLAKLFPRPKVAVPALLDALDDPDPATRFHAAHALCNVYAIEIQSRNAAFPAGPVVPVLAEALRDGDRATRRRTAFLLTTLGDWSRGAKKALAAALKDRDALVRVYAATALEPRDANAPGLLAALIEGLRDPEACPQAAQVLQKMGPRAAEAVPALVRVVRADPANRVAAVNALAAVGEPALPAVRKLLAEKDAAIRQSAVSALYQMGPLAQAAAGDLVEVLHGARDEGEIRFTAETLGRFGESAKAAVPALVRIAGQKKYEAATRVVVLQALAQIGPAAREAVPELGRLLDAAEPAVRRQIIRTLGKIDPEAETK